MTTPTNRGPVEPDPLDEDRYVSFDLEDGVVICDENVDTAWVKSDTSIPLGETS